jgi:EmrB/QacA subfamily drug resistance transporter
MTNIFRPPCDEGVIRARPAALPYAAGSEPWIMAATILGSSMVFIDGTVVNVALPALQKSLGASVLDVQWVVESYALFLAALLLVGGSMGDRYGRRRMFCAGVALFGVASVVCGLAQNIGQLIAARALQGVAGALLVPGSLAIISASFDEARRGQAIGTWSAFTAITAGIGPILGGWLIEHVSWRAAFFINVPVALLVLLISYWRVSESRDDAATAALDWWGAMLASFGFGALVYALIESSRLGFAHPVALVTLQGGVILLAVFFLVEARSANPMLPLALFRSRNFAGANLLTIFLYTALAGGMFFFPLRLIQIEGYSATAAGAAWVPFILIIFILSPRSGSLVKRYGPRPLLVLGPSITALGYSLFMMPGAGGTYWNTFFPAIIVLGIGMGLSVAPLTTTVMNSVPGHRAGIASGINNAVSRIGGLLGVAIFGIIMVHSFNTELDRRLTLIDLPYSARSIMDEQRARLAGVEIPLNIERETRAALTEAINESFIFGFRLVMFAAAGLALASALVAFKLIENK